MVILRTLSQVDGAAPATPLGDRFEVDAVPLSTACAGCDIGLVLIGRAQGFFGRQPPKAPGCVPDIAGAQRDTMLGQQPSLELGQRDPRSDNAYAPPAPGSVRQTACAALSTAPKSRSRKSCE